MNPQARQGISLVEALVALLLGLWALHMSLALLASQRTGVAQLVRRSEILTTLWMARTVLDTELGRGVEGRDWWVGPGDSVALRAFRATAVVCALSGAVDLDASVRGDRAADPAKDSVLLFMEDGHWEPRGLVRVRPASGSCADRAWGTGWRWTVSDSIAGVPLLARLFERGSYHVQGGALRYRRGRAGRQPLTPGVLGPGSGLERRGRSARLRLDITGTDGILGGSWVGRVGGGR